MNKYRATMNEYMRLIVLFFVATGLLVNGLGQTTPLKVDYFYPKDSMRFNKAVSGIDFNCEKGLYGKTTMVIHTESSGGQFEFMFKKKIKSIEKYGGDYSDVYGMKPDGTMGVVRQDYNEPYTISQHDLYALIWLRDEGGFREVVKFQDFGNEVYWPEFDYPHCSVSDENRDGIPEFYLTYWGDSDGLDAKPYKQIIYTQQGGESRFVKSKATAFYPAGNEEDVYRVVYDENWTRLPKAIQDKSKGILKLDREKRGL